MSGIPRLHSNLPPPAPCWGTAPCPLPLAKVDQSEQTCLYLHSSPLCLSWEITPPVPPAKSTVRPLAVQIDPLRFSFLNRSFFSISSAELVLEIVIFFIYFFFEAMQRECDVAYKVGKLHPIHICFLKVQDRPLSVRGSCFNSFGMWASNVSLALEGCYYSVSVLNKQRMWTSPYTTCVFVLEKWVWHCVGVNLQVIHQHIFSLSFAL